MNLIYMYVCIYINASTFRSIQLLQDDIYFDLSSSCGCGTTFRPVQLPRDDISTCPAASGRRFDLSSSSGTTLRPILLLWDDISTC